MKCFLYAYHQIPVDSHSLLNFNKICPNDKLNIVHGDGESCAVGSGELLHRRRKVKITVTIRSGDGRQYLNLIQLQQLILHELSEDSLPFSVDKEWFKTHMVHLGSLTPREQMMIFAESDIVIVGHGAEVMNALFMRAGSVLIDVFHGPYYENYFQPMLQELEVHMTPLTVMNHTRQNECLYQAPPHCAQGSLVAGNASDCIPIRQCNLYFDLKQMKQILQQSYFQLLLSGKFLYPPDKL